MSLALSQSMWASQHRAGPERNKDGYVMGDVGKDFLLYLIKRLSSVYFAEVLGFCLPR